MATPTCLEPPKKQPATQPIIEQQADSTELEQQHKRNLEEKAKLEELKAVLESDEQDLNTLRMEILQLIKKRMVQT